MGDYTFFRFEIQHIFPIEIFDQFGPKLAKAGLGVQMQGNLIALFSNPDTAAAMRDAPQAVQDLLQQTGWGANSHDSRGPDASHRAYTSFLAGKLDDMLAGLGENDPLPDHTRLAVLDLFDYATRVSAGEVSVNGSVIPINGASLADLEAGYQNTRSLTDARPSAAGTMQPASYAEPAELRADRREIRAVLCR